MNEKLKLSAIWIMFHGSMSLSSPPIWGGLDSKTQNGGLNYSNFNGSNSNFNGSNWKIKL